MEDRLLVRVYSVGFGDCIYVRIPDDGDYFHMLIDCGTLDSLETLKPAVNDVYSLLPVGPDGRKRLDLLVATHPHVDHIRGFDPEWFARIQIERIWLSVFMKPDHPQAARALAFQNSADNAALALLERRSIQLSPGAQSLLARCIWNRGALQALNRDLAQAGGIHPQYPLYVARDLAGRQSPEEREQYGIAYEQGTTCFRGFRDQGISLRVLAPEWDIDRYYLGDGTMYTAPLIEQSAQAQSPGNISERDFGRLRSRLLYSTLSFAQESDHLTNNTSIVLLLEWRGRRLLFAGDAEWEGMGVREGRRNRSWDVMLHQPEIKQVLAQPLDFLKAAHHGSIHGTPFVRGGKEQFLHRMVPEDRTLVVVSTVSGQHGYTEPVPYPPLMKELGSLACNRQVYRQWYDPKLKEYPYQPQRTDLEGGADLERVGYVEVLLAPADY